MFEKMNKKEYENYTKDRLKNRYKCKCGHSITIPAFMRYKICSWCGHKVYTRKGKSQEFILAYKNAVAKIQKNY